MTYAKPMLEAHPRDFNLDAEVLARCIEACYECAQACSACADDCLSEEGVADLVKCIRLNEDCGDICLTGTRGQPPDRVRRQQHHARGDRSLRAGVPLVRRGVRTPCV